jgi:hypothetical protein
MQQNLFRLQSNTRIGQNPQQNPMFIQCNKQSKHILDHPKKIVFPLPINAVQTLFQIHQRR